MFRDGQSKDRRHQSITVRTTLDKNARLHTDPHYSDSRFKNEQTLFGKEDDGLEYVYSDRLYQWDYAKHESAWEAAKESKVAPKTCAFFEKYLSAYFDMPKVIGCIIAGVNVSNGYSYLVFGYKDAE